MMAIARFAEACELRGCFSNLATGLSLIHSEKSTPTQKQRADRYIKDALNKLSVYCSLNISDPELAKIFDENVKHSLSQLNSTPNYSSMKKEEAGEYIDQFFALSEILGGLARFREPSYPNVI